MPTLREKIESAVKEALEAETRPLFPRIYDGFKEADALAEGEDRLLEVLSNLIYRYFQDRNLRTITEAKAAEYEAVLGIEPAGGIEARRAAIINAINRQFVLNDAKLHELCQALADGHDIEERTDPQALTLGIFSADDEDGGESPTLEVVRGIRPVIPLNLAVFAGVETSYTKNVTANHGHATTIWGHLGLVSEIGPQPPAQAIIIGQANTVPAGTRTLRSEYYWIYEFSGGSSLNNLWHPAYYAESLVPNAGTVMSTIPSTAFTDVAIWDGTTAIPLAGGSIQYRLDIYQNQPEFYTDSSDAVTGANCGVIMAMQSDAQIFNQADFALPEDLYTIRGTAIIWNTTHALYQLLAGKTATCSYT